jgi:hypothetical protein
MTLRIERRDFGLVEVRATDEAVGKFSGYGAIFGNTDSYGDVIERGAFSDTLSEWSDRGKWPPMLLQHGGGFFGGGADDMLPVGKWDSMEENSKGLKVEGELFAVNTERGQYIYEGLKSGVLDGLSIGFLTREFRAGTKPDEPDRTLTNIDLWEVSIVTFPANPKARVGAVKSLTTEELRDLEAILRDEGLSQRDAKTALSGFRKWLQRDAAAPVSAPRDEVVPEVAEIMEALDKLSDGMWSEVFRSR